MYTRILIIFFWGRRSQREGEGAGCVNTAPMFRYTPGIGCALSMSRCCLRTRSALVRCGARTVCTFFGNEARHCYTVCLCLSICGCSCCYCSEWMIYSLLRNALSEGWDRPTGATSGCSKFRGTPSCYVACLVSPVFRYCPAARPDRAQTRLTIPCTTLHCTAKLYV